MNRSLVMTLIGRDRPGLVEAVAAIASQVVQPLVGKTKELFRVGVGDGEGVEHLVRGHHHEGAGNRLPRDIAIRQGVLAGQTAGQLGVEIASHLSCGAADRGHLPAVDGLDVGRQQ